MRPLFIKSSNNRGFTLLEVIMSVSILVVMAIGAASLLRSSFDMKFALGQNVKVTQRMTRVMKRIAEDLEHAYIISDKDQERFSLARYGKTIFKLTKTGTDKLALTTMSHRPLKKDAKESDLTYVVYELRKSETFLGRTHLFRGEAPFVSDNLDQEPTMELLAKHIKLVQFEPWDGTRWSKNRWDSTSGETTNKLPYMVKIRIEAWDDDPIEGEDVFSDVDDPSDFLTTVIYVNRAVEFPEIKQASSNIKWRL